MFIFLGLGIGATSPKNIAQGSISMLAALNEHYSAKSGRQPQQSDVSDARRTVRISETRNVVIKHTPMF